MRARHRKRRADLELMSKTNRYLIACGGHGRVVLDALLSSKQNVTGIIDTQLQVGSLVFDVPVVGNDDFLMEDVGSTAELVNGFGTRKDTKKRREIFERWTKLGFTFVGVQHPSITIGRECNIDSSVQLMAGVVLQNRIGIGLNVVINTRSSIDHDVRIGDHVVISPGAVVCGDVKIGQGTFIGAGAVIIQGIEIGKNCIIGAGAVVRLNVKDSTTVVGNPATQLE